MLTLRAITPNYVSIIAHGVINVQNVAEDWDKDIIKVEEVVSRSLIFKKYSLSYSSHCTEPSNLQAHKNYSFSTFIQNIISS